MLSSRLLVALFAVGGVRLTNRSLLRAACGRLPRTCGHWYIVLKWLVSRWIPAFCVVLLAGCLTLTGLWLNAESCLRRLQKQVHYPLDAPLERLAYQVKARSERSSISEIEHLLFPVTVSFPDRRCVELRPRWGVVGGTSISCFSNKTGKLLTHYNIGQ